MTLSVRTLSHRRPLLTQLARLSLALAAVTGCAKLDPFGADLGRVQSGSKTVRAPYLATLGYFGYLDGTAATLDAVDGKPMQAVYVWLPAATSELGVRLLSPSKPFAKPDRSKDAVTEAWLAHKGDKKGFDPSVAVERCASVVDPTDSDRPCNEWVALGRSEDVAGPQGDHDGHDRAELRLQSHPEDASRNLVRGLYRIGVADLAHAGAQGSFFLQLGVPVYLDGAAAAPSLAELGALVRQKSQGLAQVPNIGHAHEAPALPTTPTPAPIGDALAPNHEQNLAPQQK